MKCVKCGKPTRVIETDKEAWANSRKRQCPEGHRFVTEEVFVRHVVPGNNRRAPMGDVK